MRIPQAIMLAAAATTTQQVINVSNDVMTDSILAAVYGVHNSCLVNTDMFSHYTGGPLPVTTIDGKPVLLTFAAVNGAQTKILTDSIMTPKISAANFQRAASTVLETLQFSVPATGEAMVAKIPQLKEAGLIDAARNGLELLLHNHKTAGAAISPKVDTSNATLAEALEKEVEDVTERLTNAINTFREVDVAGSNTDIIMSGKSADRASSGAAFFAWIRRLSGVKKSC